MTEITDLNPTDASNTSITGESLQGNVANMGRMDNTLQAILGMVGRWTSSDTIASATTTDIGGQAEAYLTVSGTTTITGFGTVRSGTIRFLRFSGILTLTHNATSLILPGAANIMTAAGDTAVFVSEGSGNWRCLFYTRASGAPITTNYAGKLDTRRNRIVNHDMRMDQEWNGAAGTTNGRHGRDQFATYFNSSAATITTQGVSSVTPAGSPNRYRVTITTADTSLAAGEFLTISQNLEGSNVADFQYGGANAKQSVLRFGFKGPAGTYAVHLGNSAANRSYVALFTIAAPDANTDTVQTLSIPGDTTGTWLTADGVIGITLDIVLACGSTFQGATGWQAGNILGTSGVSNGMGTGSAVFELFDVGLRLDPDATGVYGQYEVGEVGPVYRSERYWEKSYDDTVAVNTINQAGMVTGVAAGSGLFWGFAPFKVKKCKSVNPTIYNPFAVNAGTIRNATSGTDISTSGQYPGQNSFVIIASTTGGSLMAFHWVVNARLT